MALRPPARPPHLPPPPAPAPLASGLLPDNSHSQPRRALKQQQSITLSSDTDDSDVQVEQRQPVSKKRRVTFEGEEGERDAAEGTGKGKGQAKANGKGKGQGRQRREFVLSSSSDNDQEEEPQNGDGGAPVAAGSGQRGRGRAAEQYRDEGGDVVMDHYLLPLPPPPQASGSGSGSGAAKPFVPPRRGSPSPPPPGTLLGARSPSSSSNQKPDETPPAASASSSSSAADEAAFKLATILSILPDVLPSYVTSLLALPMYGPGNVELVVEALLSAESYPKAAAASASGTGATASGAGGANGGKGKGKGKAKEGVDGEGEAEKEEGWGDEEQEQEERDREVERRAKGWLEAGTRRREGGKVYEEAALAQLYLDFPQIQQANLKRLFLSPSASSFYAPAYIEAEKALGMSDEERGWALMKGKGARAKGKGKECEELERERKWVMEELSTYTLLLSRQLLTSAALEAEIADGAVFECGCCFAETALSQLVCCEAGCDFCKDCARMNAESQIGMRKYNLPCMSTSMCSSHFSEHEAQRFLGRKSLNALHKIRQEKELGEAEIEGLEQCPFCPFAYIIENPDERLFRCQREDCLVVSCRTCKKQDHLPKTCAEVSDDAKISAVHHVAEAMSASLIRKCPKCSEPYIKENASCNKITCTSCRTLSCYLCGKIVTGYQHFRNAGSNAPQGSDKGSTCDLWDDTASRNYQEVEAARLAAEQEVRLRNAHITAEDLEKLGAGAMDKPDAPPGIIAHLAAPRVAAYAALVAQGAAEALPPNAVAGRYNPPPAPPAAAVTPKRPTAAQLRREQAALEVAKVQARAEAARAAAARKVAPVPKGMYNPPLYPHLAPPPPLAGPAPIAAGGHQPAPLNARNLAALARPARFGGPPPLLHPPPLPPVGGGGGDGGGGGLGPQQADVNERYRAHQEHRARMEEIRVRVERERREREEAERRRRREKDEERERKRERTRRKRPAEEE